MSPQDFEAALDLLNETLKISPETDFTLIGDGSGSKWGFGTGWAALAIVKGEMSPRIFHGGSNEGTVSTAELMAYLLPLSWYSASIEGQPVKLRQAHIITDSKYLADMGTTKKIPLKHAVFWYALNAFNHIGINLTWHHIPRESNPLNAYVDRLSRSARLAIEAILPKKSKEPTHAPVLKR
jgi:ribonuclease HI